MAVTKDRYQNPVIGDIVKLEFFVYNSNAPAEVDDISKIEIYYLDPANVTTINPFGKTLVQTIPGADVTNPATGEYRYDLYLDPAIYTDVGRFIDQWYTTFRSGDVETSFEQVFEVYSDLWYTTPIPIVYDFSFYFQPNKIRQGSKKFLEIEVIPNVPRATDLFTYYENLVISANLSVYMEANCNPCIPCGGELIVDGATTQFRERNRAFFKIDTSCLDCGIYNIWFKLEFGDNIYVSDKNQLIVYA